MIPLLTCNNVWASEAEQKQYCIRLANDIFILPINLPLQRKHKIRTGETGYALHHIGCPFSAGDGCKPPGIGSISLYILFPHRVEIRFEILDKIARQHTPMTKLFDNISGMPLRGDQQIALLNIRTAQVEFRIHIKILFATNCFNAASDKNSPLKPSV